MTMSRHNAAIFIQGFKQTRSIIIININQVEKGRGKQRLTTLIQAKQCCQAENQTKISQSDFYRTIFLPKIRPKANPNSQFGGQNQTNFKNLIPTLGKSTFI